MLPGVISCFCFFRLVAFLLCTIDAMMLMGCACKILHGCNFLLFVSAREYVCACGDMLVAGSANPDRIVLSSYKNGNTM